MSEYRGEVKWTTEEDEEKNKVKEMADKGVGMIRRRRGKIGNRVRYARRKNRKEIAKRDCEWKNKK